MYCLKFSLYGSRSDRLALSAIYEQIAERYFLPSLHQLRQSIDSSIVWPAGDYQAYYLDSLREQQTKHLFQVRMRTQKASRNYSDIFMSMESQAPYALLNMTLQFPPSGDRGFSSFVLGLLKEFQKEQNLDIDFLLEGVLERPGFFKDISLREQSLSAFRWIPELERYLHVRERVEDVQEIRRQRR